MDNEMIITLLLVISSLIVCILITRLFLYSLIFITGVRIYKTIKKFVEKL